MFQSNMSQPWNRPPAVNQVRSNRVRSNKVPIHHDRFAYVVIPEQVSRGMSFIAVEHSGDEMSVAWRGNAGDKVGDAVARSLCSYSLGSDSMVAKITESEFAGMHQECDCEQPLIRATDERIDVAIILPLNPGHGYQTVKQCNCGRCGQTVLLKEPGLTLKKAS